MQKFYEVKRQLNNLYWQTEAYFLNKNEAKKYINRTKARLRKENLSWPFKIEEHEFTQLK